MGSNETWVIVGGGYAGIHFLKEMRKEFSEQLKQKVKLILIDKNPYHLKKVKLFKAIVEDSHALQVPLTLYGHAEVTFLQGEVSAVHSEAKKIIMTDPNGESRDISFDRLIIAVGSVLREMPSVQGGFSLTSVHSAKKMREHLLGLIRSNQSKLRVAVIGGGITGMETAPELAVWLKGEAKKAGKDPNHVEVLLINSDERLLPQAPLKISQRLERSLHRQGVQVIHQTKVDRIQGEEMVLQNGSSIQADCGIWTVGVKAHPSLQGLGLPLDGNGKVIVNSSYQMISNPRIYAIGDCAHVVDPHSGEAASMTCKEAIAQAQRLTKNLKAEMQGTAPESHQTYPPIYCIGLGPQDALVWAQKWGMDFVIGGKLGAKIREITWEFASTVN